MGSMNPRVELLAPAKDLSSGIAAIDSGADAVYIGAARYGARSRAGNSLADIATLVEHAHTLSWPKNAIHARISRLARLTHLGNPPG